MTLTRMCVGCRGRDTTEQLVRVVRQGDGIAIDLARIAPGRGAYVHRNPECLTSAARSLPRALRVSHRIDSVVLLALANTPTIHREN
jgi:predicted RNA-binding protein YlxR (DUF448 family)